MLREDSIAESAKQRSLRVPLDHFVRTNWIVRAKYFLTAMAAAIAAAYVAWIFLGGKVGQMQASPGPLAAVHAGWDNDCQVCHQNLKPLRSDAVHLTSLGATRASIRESLDQKCIACHNEPEHHHAAKPDEVMSCSTCHRDHLGRMADIVRPADNNCLGCHQQIDQHRNGPSALANAIKNVTGFGPIPASGEGPHPEFRSLSSDPGNIKFNHWLHMQPGVAVKDLDEKKKKKLEDLDERFRPQYAKFAKAGGLIELDCTACHENDAGGQYKKPIAYEQHCQACHPLQLSLPDGRPLSPDQSLAEGKPFAEVPHGLTPSRLAPVVDGLLHAALQKQPASQTEGEKSAAPRIPGRTLGNNLAQEIHRDIRGNASKAITLQCQLCHEAKPSGESTVALPDVLPPNIPNQWLRHARFDHNSHRHVQYECKACHEAAFDFEKRDEPQLLKPTAEVPKATVARDSEKVMIAQLGDKNGCAKCHNPELSTPERARHDCAECHNYHDRDKLIGGDKLISAKPAMTLSFQGPTLAPRKPAALAAPPSPAPLELRLASFTALAAPSPAFVGASSCASVGCHGDVQSKALVERIGKTTEGKEKEIARRTAVTAFFANDPHVQAYDVLWTNRGREMTRLLASPAKAEEQSLSDAAHFQVLQERCIGCHATPLPEGAAASENSYVLGVHCESCHGPAGGWLHTHYQTGFESNEAVRSAAPGFADTKKLDSRAAACMKCHVGPNDAAGSPQVVDHDLIAAGHPRLAFEFQSYFQSLPAHWNRQVDEAKQPGAFHFRSWLAGHEQVAKHKQQLAQERPLDFANMDCYACHHSLAAESWRQRSNFTGPKPAPWPSSAVPKVNSATSVASRLDLAHALIESSKTDGRWDVALLSYLATRAIAADIPNVQIPSDKRPQVMADLAKLDSALISLAAYLGETSFSVRRSAGGQPTPYDSPTAFDPKSSSYAGVVKPALDTLEQLEAATTAP